MSNLKDDFDYLKINLASPNSVKKWGTRVSNNGIINLGEITATETINYKTLRPQTNGLLCEKIFGPLKNWECACGKYTKAKENEILICEECNIEITESRVRRYRMGYITLISPTTHIWYLKGRPSYLSLFLKRRQSTLEKIIYFHNNLDGKTLPEKASKLLSLDDFLLSLADEFSVNKNATDNGSAIIKLALNQLVLNNELIKDRITLGLLNNSYEFYKEHNKVYIPNPKEKREKLIRRIRLIENFLATNSHPNWIVLDILPVLPAGLRPMLQLESGKLATSDLNELYRRVIDRNLRLERLFKIVAPRMIIFNEKRMLQEAVDALIDNGKRGRKAVGANNRPLKSLSELLEGKQGRFRQNLLGKRVDYSGRSVIMVDPLLKLHQCGLPYEMALELFEPFIIHRLITGGVAYNVEFAKNLIQLGEIVVWDILKNILSDHPILLNRAPTLHRLGVQAFEAKLVIGRAIHLHPLVCNAFNADFDGDQMAVHIPLSLEAINETKKLLLSPNNFISSATGTPIITPSQDMVLGCYYLTLDNPSYKNSLNHYFSNYKDLLIAYENKKILLHTPVWVRTSKIIEVVKDFISNNKNQSTKIVNQCKYIKTTVGRVILNNTIYKNLYL
jgi:DNA-directed RNA polymerase subunit beta'